MAALLASAVRAGTRDEATWSHAFPDGDRQRFDRDLATAITAPPTGAAAVADMAAVKAAQASRTAQLDAVARAHDERAGWDAWDAAIAEIDASQGAAQARHAKDLVLASMHRTDAIVAAAKVQFARLRPFEVDSSVTTVTKRPSGNAGYPSGHASGAYAAAVVLGGFLPGRAADLLASAAQVAYSRVYAGVHFPTDVATGAYVATRVAADVLRRDGRSVPANSLRAALLGTRAAAA